MTEDGKKIVVLDDDHDVAHIIETVLIDEGFRVSSLHGPDDETIERAVLDLSPDCVIVSGSGPPRSPDPWAVARSLATHEPPIPTVLLTGRAANREEAMLGESARAKSAGFLAVVPKPFDVDQLVAAVRNALGATGSSEQSRSTAANDTTKVMERLRAAGVQELRTSDAGREWITFRLKRHGELYKLYRWPAAGTYFVGKYAPNGERLEQLVELYESEDAVVYCERLIEHERAES